MKEKDRKDIEIKVDPNNARFHDEENKALIRKSLKELGAGRSIVIDKTNTTIGGAGVYEQAQELGIPVKVIESDGSELIVVKRVDLDYNDEKRKELAIADNSTSDSSHFIAEKFEDEYFEGIDFLQWGVDPSRDQEDELVVEDDNFDFPDQIQTDIIIGDLFEIGEHRLICGSSTEIDIWSKLMKNELCDLVVTDPPYNVDYVGKTKSSLKILSDSMKDDDFYQFLFDSFKALQAYTKPGGAWYVWHADTEGANFRLAMKNSGILLKQCLVWVKNSMVLGRQDYHWRHEPCLYGWKEGAAHNWFSDRKQTTVLEFDKPNINKEHPTMKPLGLIAYQITNSSKKGDLVCDGFLGSGTTMVAAHKLGRKCYGVELDPLYCQVIIDRMLKIEKDITLFRNGVDVTNSYIEKLTTTN